MPRISRNDLIALLTVVSIMMLAASLALADSWWSDLLLQLGSALLLVVPFLLITRHIESRISTAEEATRGAISETRRQVDELTAEVAKVAMARSSSEIDALIAQRLDDDHKADRALFAGLARAPSRSDVAHALHRASALGIIARFGIRVRLIGPSGLYLWFRPDTTVEPDQDPLNIVVQEFNLRPTLETHWDRNVGFIDFMISIAAALRTTSHWNGDAYFKPGESFANLSRILLSGQQARFDGDPEKASEIFEIIEDELFEASSGYLSNDEAVRENREGREWIVGQEFLTCRDPLYHIQYRDLRRINWVKHMAEKMWVKQRVFQRSLDAAACLIAHGIAEGPLPDYLHGVWEVTETGEPYQPYRVGDPARAAGRKDEQE